MTERQADILALLVQKIEEFKIGRKIAPNAVLISLDHVELLSELSGEVLQEKLPGIDCLVPVPESPAFQGYDLPLPALLPVIATKSQREKINSLLSGNL